MPLSKRQLLILAGVGAVILILLAAIMLGRQRPGAGGELVVWGVIDSAEVYQEIFSNLEQRAGISATYLQKDILTYERELINALAAGRGPDVMMIHNSWLGKHFDKLLPAPPEIVSPAAVHNLYPDVVTEDFVSGGQVWALPLSIDTLALFYNRDLFNQAGLAVPPRTWEEVLEIAPRLTRVDAVGALEQSAIALGTVNNIGHASDILAMLMMQFGSPIVDRQNLAAVFNRSTDFAADSAGQSALELYLRFANPAERVYTWNSEQIHSIDAFSQGTLAMMLSYAFEIPAVLEKGPFLDFDIAPLPQPRVRRDRVDYAHYWGFAVSRQSRNPSAAWRFISLLTGPESARMYLQKTGRPPALRALIQQNINQPTRGVFARQALTAKSWFQPDPAEVERIFLGMAESARRRELSAGEAVRRAVEQVNLLLGRFRE